MWDSDNREGMMKYIENLREGMRISEVYLCKSKQILTTKVGKEYGSLILQDKTGTVDAKIWDLGSPGIGDFETVDYVFVDADINIFNDKLQLNIRRIRKANEGEYVASDYLPTSSKDIDTMYNELKEKIFSVKDINYNVLLSKFFIEDKAFVERFKYASAAKSVHHGFVCGLLEHTLSVANMCDYFCLTYPMLKRDLLITAAIFHDIGKVKEISAFPENDYTDIGQLLGHIVIGSNMICEKAKEIESFPEKKLNELIHCILSHHGELEYGSPKKPAILEAFALNFADNTDAKMETVIEILNTAKDNNSWLGYNRMFETNIRKTSE